MLWRNWKKRYGRQQRQREEAITVTVTWSWSSSRDEAIDVDLVRREGDGSDYGEQARLRLTRKEAETLRRSLEQALKNFQKAKGASEEESRLSLRRDYYPGSNDNHPFIIDKRERT